MTTFEQLVAAADGGGMLEATLIAVDGSGPLRVTYNWLYSALNCDPADQSPFVWSISKLDETHVSLSPRDPFDGKRLYASVRDDYDWTLQVQAPFSADWITAVGRDEVLTMQGQDLLVASLLGFNGQYVARDAGVTSHDGHSGRLLHSIGSPVPAARMWFLAVSAVLQPGLAIPLAADLKAADVAAALAASGLDDAPQTVQTILSSVR